ncbi:MAG: hypothetical protein ACM335_12535 [Deltaproteobacteria bacterium]
MSEEIVKQILETLREIREGQKDILAKLEEQRSLAEEQMRKSGARIEESVNLQRQALLKQRSITLIAVPGILVCILAIAYLVFRYF